jgi:hypothetical protein
MPQRRDERALCLLKEALTREGADDQAEAFVLALYLARKRLLILRQELVTEDHIPRLLYEIPAVEEMLCVRKLALDDSQAKKIQQTLAIKFSQHE